MKVYFDFLCPYCYKGVTDLLDIIKKHPELAIDWEPVEAHPRPEYAGQYSDIASQGLMFLKEHGGDTAAYCRLIYEKHYREGRRIDDIGILSEAAVCAEADRDEFTEALKDKRYEKAVLANNELVWEILRFDAVPDYVEGSRSLLSAEDHMIPREKLESFISELSEGLKL